MRKLLACLLTLLLAALTGCGGPAPSPETDGASITMGFSQIGAESAWREAHTKSVQQAAADAGIRLVYAEADQSQADQVAAIRSFIAQGVDIIAFVPIIETGWDDVLAEAKAAGIPVIIVDRDVRLTDDSLYAAKIGTDSLTEGKNVFRWLDEYQQKAGKKPRDGGTRYHIVVLEGTVGASVAIGRQNGFRNAMAAAPDAAKYDILASRTGDFTRARGEEIMNAYLRVYGSKIDILFSHNDDMALGAIRAIEAAGLRPGEDITIVSIDGIHDMFQAMIDGKANCTVECNPLQGPILMETAKKVLRGVPVEKHIYVEEGVFPASVAAEALPDRKY